MHEVDRYAICALCRNRAARSSTPTIATTIPTIFQRLNQLPTVDLSAFYADVSKDRLYTFAAGSPERRSAQTAMYLMADGLARLLGTDLSDHGGRAVAAPAGPRKEESVHIAEFPTTESLEQMRDPGSGGRAGSG